MRQAILSATMFAAALVAAPHVEAATQTVTGTIGSLFVQSTVTGAGRPAGTIVFQISTAPASTGCAAGSGFFEYSATSVTDAETRSNMTAALLSAKTNSLTVTIIYDDAGAYCDSQGYAVPIDVVLP